MEKIGPLIDDLTISKKITPSDLTQDYGSVVFPEPLSVNEVRDTYDQRRYLVAQRASSKREDEYRMLPLEI